MKFNIVLSATLFFCLSTYSQEKTIICEQSKENYEYYQIAVLVKDMRPQFINVVGKKINFDNLSKQSLATFVNELFEKSIFVPSFLSDRDFYLKKCERITIDKVTDLKFMGKFNSEVERLSKKNIKYYDLKTGEKIIVKGIFIEGVFLKYSIDNFKFQQISFYPQEIYECSNISNYMVPLTITKFGKLKKCTK